MAEISHACIYNSESEDFEVVKLSDFVRLPKPQTYKDFQVNNLYTIKTGKTFVDVEIIAVGDLHEMEAEANIVAECKITHAVVQFKENLEYKVIEISMIKEFSKFVPEYKTRFFPMKKYHATRNNKETFEDVYIHAFGDEQEMCVMRESLLEPPSHAIVRYIDNNAINVLDIKDMHKGLWDFKHNKDFDGYAFYKTKASFEPDEIAKDIQVLTLGQLCDCNTQLQSWMQMSHILIRQIKLDKCLIVDVKHIEEFEGNPPETENDFTPQKPYVFLDKRNHKKVAVEIYSMGCKEKIVFECLHSSKRFAKKKFATSDIELIEGPTNKQILSPSSTKKKKIGQPGKGGKFLTNRKSLDKKQLLLNKKKRNTMTINSSSSGSDDESITAKCTKDLNNNKGCDDNNTDDEDIDVLNQRLRGDPTVPSPGHSPTGSTANVRRRLFDDDMNSPDRSVNRNSFSRQRHQNPSLNSKNHHRHRMHNRPPQKRKFVAKSSLESHLKVPRVRKSDEEEFYQAYWSDSSIGERDYNIFEEWIDYGSDNETSTSMIHVGWTHSIPTKSWRTITKSKNASLFTKRMSRCLWKEEIINKCVELKEYYMKSVTDKPRTEVTPSKMKAIHQCLKYWVLVYHPDWLYSQTLDDILRKLEHYLGEEISYQIKEYDKARNPNKEKKKKKTWRD